MGEGVSQSLPCPMGLTEQSCLALFGTQPLDHLTQAVGPPHKHSEWALLGVTGTSGRRCAQHAAPQSPTCLRARSYTAQQLLLEPRHSPQSPGAWSGVLGAGGPAWGLVWGSGGQGPGLGQELLWDTPSPAPALFSSPAKTDGDGRKEQLTGESGEDEEEEEEDFKPSDGSENEMETEILDYV